MVKVALLVRLQAKPGKEAAVATFLKAPSPWRIRKPPRRSGLRYGWDNLLSGSSTPSLTKQGAQHIWQVRLQRR